MFDVFTSLKNEIVRKKLALSYKYSTLCTQPEGLKDNAKETYALCGLSLPIERFERSGHAVYFYDKLNVKKGAST